jgi:leucyl aminopeptidase
MSFEVLSLKPISYLQKGLVNRVTAKGTEVHHIHFVGRGQDLPGSLKKMVPDHLKKSLANKSSLENFSGRNGEHWVLQAQIVSSGNHYELFSPSPYSMARDLAGTCLRQCQQKGAKQVQVHYYGDSEDELVGLCSGFEIAQYKFKDLWPKEKKSILKIHIQAPFKNFKSLIKQGAVLGEAVNMARFLVDLPPNVLSPKSYAELIKSHFSAMAKCHVTVWDHKRLIKENMGLHVAVGQGSRDQSYMVKVSYRGLGQKVPPIAFVGKGITFDSGGLDIKPSTGMRLMKKDMGGSASVVGLAHQVITSKPPINCDFYFALAENAINQDSFRPGDILQARNGKTVEIHNTDAEGRLVLADVMTVASETQPKFLLDVATLTGAIKVGLSSSVPGLFSNSDNLADSLLRSGQIRGDQFWRMPLIPQEKSRLKSDVADMVNCTEGYGGAVTAALFLEHFTGNIPWAHLDIYAWNDRATGIYGAAGGSGQVVQALAHFVEQQAQAQ